MRPGIVGLLVAWVIWVVGFILFGFHTLRFAVVVTVALAVGISGIIYEFHVEGAIDD